MEPGGRDLFNDLSEHISLNIHSCFEETAASPWHESKAHADYDIWLVSEGAVDVVAHGRKVTASVGDAVFFPPGIPYTADTKSARLRFIYVHFDYGIGNNGRVLDEFNLAGVVRAARIRKEASLFREGFQKYRASAPTSALLLKGCLIILIARILELRGTDDILRFFPEAPRGGGKRGLSALSPVLGYIDRRLPSLPGMRGLAAIAGMSEKYFIALFKDVVGITPGRYIHQLKMNRAREYIYGKQHSCKEIAAMLGYPDQYSFSKAFKKHYNVPPSKFT